VTGECRTDRRTNRGNLILGLKCLDTKILVLRKLVKHVRCRRNTGNCRKKAGAQRSCEAVTKPIAVASLPMMLRLPAGFDFRLANTVVSGEDLGCIGVIVACLDGEIVRNTDIGAALNFSSIHRKVGSSGRS
jgi:hypothetical protein